MAVLSLQDISFSYETDCPILQNLSYDFHSNQCVAIIGPSGCGKTTLLHLIAQWSPPSSGSIAVHSEASDPHDLALFRYVYSSALLIEELSVEDNIFLDRKRTPALMALYHKLLEYFQLPQRTTMWPKMLSSGQQQRAGMMRALLGDAFFLLADEPTSHLDPPRAFDLMKTLIALLKQTGRGLICVTHDRNLLPLFDSTLNLE